MTARDLVFESASRLAELIRTRQVSAVEVVDAHIRRIEAVNPALNALVTVDFDRARTEARAADEHLARGNPIGALHGVPMTIKDAIDVAGLRTVAGSKLFVDRVAEADAPSVGRLRGAGAIVLGKTNVPECAMDWRTTNPVFGRTNNPWNVAHSPGGSSGGEAAAIAAGCSAGGLGSDLGGSIRVPAHFCGICGLRPTPGRVSASGFATSAAGPFSLVHSFGPLARSVDDLQLFFAVLAGFDPGDPASVPLPAFVPAQVNPRDLHLAACVDGGIPVTAETRQAVEHAADVLTRCGAEIATWTLPEVAEAPQVFAEWVMQSSLPAILAPYRGREDAMGPLVRGLSKLAQPRSLEQFLEAWSARDRIRHAILDHLQQRPVVIMPVCSTAAFRHDERGPLQADGGPVDYVVSFGYAELASLAGLPAVVVPVARTPAGLPIGVQLVGRPFDEPLLLSVARMLEQETGGYQRPPL